MPLTAVNLAGGVACNLDLRRMMTSAAQEHGLPLTVSPMSLNTDNAAMIAWMGHELIRNEQDVDIRGIKVDAL